MKKAPRAAPSKWSALPRSLEYERTDVDVKLMGLTFLGINKGTMKSWEDVYSSPTSMVERKTIALEHFLGPSDAGSGAAASSGQAADPKRKSRPKAKASAKAPADEERISRAKTKAAANKKKEALMNKSANHMNAVARILANDEFRDLQEVAALAGGGMYREQIECLKNMKTRQGCIGYYVDFDFGKAREACWTAVKSLPDLHGLRRVRSITLEFPKQVRQ